MRARVLLVTLVAVLAACADDPSGPVSGATPSPAPAPSPTSVAPEGVATSPVTPADEAATSAAPSIRPSGPFPVATVALHPRTGPPVEVAVHVAADRATRQRGLMGREHVPAGTGMLFVYPEDTDGAFWMKDTLVDLSIAFAEDSGRIVRILDMEPCTATPCPVYAPGQPYRTALEVPQGFFADVGVREGDRLALPDSLPEGR